MKKTLPAFYVWMLIQVPIAPVYCAEWGVGIGVVSLGSEFDGVDSQNYIVPIPYYRGERLTVDLEGLSYALFQSESFQLSAAIRGRFDGFDPDDSRALSDLEERNSGVDGGLSLSSNNDWGITELSLLADISGTSDGYELSLAYQYPIQKGRWMFAPEFGIKAGSEDLVDYYYGVDVDEVVVGRPAYQADPAVDIYLSTTASYQLSKKASLLFGVEHIRLDEVKQDSPIVDQNHRTNVVAAYLYTIK